MKNKNYLILSAISISFLIFLSLSFSKFPFSTFDSRVNLFIPLIQTSFLISISKILAYLFETSIIVIFSLFIAGFLLLKEGKNLQSLFLQ